MSNGNIFLNEANKIKRLSYDGIMQEAIELSNAFEDAQHLFNVTTICAMIGFLDNGIVSDTERKFFIELMNSIFNGADAEAACDNIESRTLDDETYSFAELLAIHPLVGMASFRLILCFAYIDGRFEESSAEKLEGIFSNALAVSFFMSGEESIPIPRERISVTELQRDMIVYFKKNDSLISLDNMCKKFIGHSKSEIKSALDELVDYGILYGGDTMFNCSYALENADDIDLDDFDVI